MTSRTVNGWTILDRNDRIYKHCELHPNDATYDVWQSGLIRDVFDLYLPENGQKRVAVDIGANYGFTAVTMANHYDQVHCFEIDTDVRACLEKNVSQYHNVQVHGVGLSNKEMDISLQIEMDERGLSTIKPNNPEEDYPRYPVKTLDSFNLTDVDLIKIDVEGWETQVILGATETLKNNSPIVIVENHGIPKRDREEGFVTRQQVMLPLLNLGYRVIDVRSNDFIFSKFTDLKANDLTDIIFPKWFRNHFLNPFK